MVITVEAGGGFPQPVTGGGQLTTYFNVQTGSHDNFALDFDRIDFFENHLVISRLIAQGEIESLPYQINGNILKIGSSEEFWEYELIESNTDYLLLRLKGDINNPTMRWYSNEAVARDWFNANRVVPPSTPIVINGSLDDWANVDDVGNRGTRSSIISITNIRYAQDIDNLYVLVEASSDISAFVSTSSQEGQHRFQFSLKALEFTILGDPTTATLVNTNNNSQLDTLSVANGDYSINGNILELRLPKSYLASSIINANLISESASFAAVNSDNRYYYSISQRPSLLLDPEAQQNPLFTTTEQALSGVWWASVVDDGVLANGAVDNHAEELNQWLHLAMQGGGSYYYSLFTDSGEVLDVGYDREIVIDDTEQTLTVTESDSQNRSIIDFDPVTGTALISRQQLATDGLSYFVTDTTNLVRTRPLPATPLADLNGEVLYFVGIDQTGQFATGYPIKQLFSAGNMVGGELVGEVVTAQKLATLIDQPNEYHRYRVEGNQLILFSDSHTQENLRLTLETNGTGELQFITTGGAQFYAYRSDGEAQNRWASSQRYPVANAAMSVDGVNSDWADIIGVATSTESQPLSAAIHINDIKVASDGTNLYVNIEADREISPFLSATSAEGWDHELLFGFGGWDFEIWSRDGLTARSDNPFDPDGSSVDITNYGGQLVVNGATAELKVPLDLLPQFNNTIGMQLQFKAVQPQIDGGNDYSYSGGGLLLDANSIIRPELQTPRLLSRIWWTTHNDDGTRQDGSVDDTTGEEPGGETLVGNPDGSWTISNGDGVYNFTADRVTLLDSLNTVILNERDGQGRVVYRVNPEGTQLFGQWQKMAPDGSWWADYETWNGQMMAPLPDSAPEAVYGQYNSGGALLNCLELRGEQTLIYPPTSRNIPTDVRNRSIQTSLSLAAVQPVTNSVLTLHQLTQEPDGSHYMLRSQGTTPLGLAYRKRVNSCTQAPATITPPAMGHAYYRMSGQNGVLESCAVIDPSSGRFTLYRDNTTTEPNLSGQLFVQVDALRLVADDGQTEFNIHRTSPLFDDGSYIVRMDQSADYYHRLQSVSCDYDTLPPTMTVMPSGAVSGEFVLDNTESVYIPFDDYELISGSVTFVDELGNPIAVPTDAKVRFVPNRYIAINDYNYSIDCAVRSDGSFGNGGCYAYSNRFNGLYLSLAYDVAETWQVVLYKDHLQDISGWNCGEDAYLYMGDNIENTIFEPFTVAPTDYQDRSGDVCDSGSSGGETTTPLFRPLNDTGLVWGGNYPEGNNTTCIGETIEQQDCAHGRDAEALAGTLTKMGAGHAGFDYTKLGANGQRLAIQDGVYDALNGSEAAGTKWSCVQDNVTGLIWEVKTDDGGIHDKDNTYRWGGVTALLTGEFGTRYSDWDELVIGSNNEMLCGFSDWRVPSVHELTSLVNSHQSNLAIDTNFFPNSGSSLFWSGSPRANLSSYGWAVNFNYGNVGDVGRLSPYGVRLVRSRE
ncbi:DUF1566 domain-containing protein [Ectothiorhodospiraceae bacterium BW-2]|nr:DUF1566 domain-containing protein [Ectothiorhodospiraceae bacterium BW-2]